MRMFQGTTVVVAGASAGMGLATALAFARQGAHLVLAARRTSALEQAVQQCEAAGASHAIAVTTDVADADQVKALAEAAIDTFGRIDVWVNMAGIGAFGPFEAIPIELQVRSIEVNLIGAMNGAHAVLPHMLQRDHGVIVNMISLGGRIAQPFATAYSASKFGLAGFTDALRHEVLARSAVQVCGVYPGFVDTPGLQHAANRSGRALRPVAPLLDPEEVAARIVGLVQRPRRALHLGMSHAAVPAYLLAPEFVGRMLGWLMARFVIPYGPRAADTDGALLTPVPEGTGMRGGWNESMPKHAGRLALAGGATLAVLALIRAARPAASRQRRPVQW